MKSRQRFAALALAAVLAFSPLSAGAEAVSTGAPVYIYEGQFSDVSAGDWYYEAVKTVYELGLVRGNGGRFDPEGELTGAEAAAMAARLRSLRETGSEPEPRTDGPWYLPYVAYLQEEGVLGRELEGAYDRPATRAEAAHILAGALSAEEDPVNQETVAAGYAAGQYIRDVTGETPYEEDILRLYSWGITGGADERGSFLPEARISRAEAAAMAARLAREELRLTLEWEILPPYSRKGTELKDLVESDGTFYASPLPEEREKIRADICRMLSRGERRISLEYPVGSLNGEFVDALLEAFLTEVRDYVEQTYNNVSALYSVRGISAVITFSSSLYDESLVEKYREETMDYAIAVHDRLWETGELTEAMTEQEKARVYFTWICENCRYDHTLQDMSHSGYRLFDEGIAVCDGYTAAYNLLLKLEGISCGTYTVGDHIWTVAVLDGRPCHIDTTWGDQEGGVAYRYFAMTEQDSLARF